MQDQEFSTNILEFFDIKEFYEVYNDWITWIHIKMNNIGNFSMKHANEGTLRDLDMSNESKGRNTSNRAIAKLSSVNVFTSNYFKVIYLRHQKLILVDLILTKVEGKLNIDSFISLI